ncbi:MAG: putative Ig domain-containing protein [Bacteriovorax sp.]|nr:putative Ig domain-containing protein [Bacteriovorax sp.]
MKKFNLKLIIPLILTLILQGCMPDSLTKFSKDTPKKATAAAAATTPTTTTTPSGQVITLVYPTAGSTFNYTVAGTIIGVKTKDLAVDSSTALSLGLIEPATIVSGVVSPGDNTITVASTNLFPNSGSIKIGTEVIIYTGKTSTTFTGLTTTAAHAISAPVAPPAPLFGSLTDPTKFSSIFLRCALDTSGATITQSLPPGMTFNTGTCGITGTPTRPYCNPIGCTNITYTVNLFYKSDAAGTEKKLTGTIDLGSYYFTNNPATILTAAITTLSDPIAVSSTNLFPITGSLLINNEIITYGVRSPLSFSGLTRGASATVAATHLINTVVTPFPDMSGVKDTLGINYPELDPLIANGFSYTETIAGVTSAISTKDMLVGTPVEFDPKTIGHDQTITAIDGPAGTLSNPARAPYIFLKCSLDQSGPLSTLTLPPGLLLNEKTCLITGTPTGAFSDTTFGNMGGNVTYKVDLFHKGANYLGDGTEIKVTALFKLKAHIQPVLSPWIPPTSLAFAPLGTTTSSLVTNFEVNVATKYIPILNGTLNLPAKFAFSFIDCALDATTPTLPPGVNLITTNCYLNGTPTALPILTNPATYKINMRYKDNTDTVQTIQATISVGVYIKPTLLTYTQHDKLLFKLDSTASLTTNADSTNVGAYDPNGLLTSANGVTGVIKFIDSASSTAGVVRLTPLKVADVTSFSTNGFIHSLATGAVIGKIVNIDSTAKIIYVERIDAANNITALDTIKFDATNTTYAAASGAAVVIASINPSYFFDSAIAALDNDSQFYSAKYNQSNITLVYEKAKAVNLAPIASAQLTAQNNLTYSISPALPIGLSFNADGSITSSFTSTKVSTKFTVTVSNPIGSTSANMYLSAIDAPKDLSYTTRELITVTSNANFNEGEPLFQPITPPLTVSVAGQVIRKYSTTQMSIATHNGQFLKGASIDSGNAFFSEKTVVSSTIDPIYYNVALIVSNSASFTASSSTVNSYAFSDAGAGGRIVAIDSGSNTLFIQYINSIGTLLFKQGDKIIGGPAYSDSTPAGVAAAIALASASGVTISQVEADNMKLTLSSVVGIKAGDDLTADAGGIGGYIHKISGSDVYVSAINRRGSHVDFFKNTQNVVNDETMSSVLGTISSTANDVFFIVERGIKTEIKSNVSLGTGTVYSTSPALPSGLTLNSLTGMITGTPSFATPRATYSITAENLVNKSKFIFELEARDYFSITENTGAPSLIFHKYGDSRGSRKCRINSTDIKNFATGVPVNSGALDVRCFLDGEEADLHFNKLKLIATAGSGVCEYIQIYPYSFWQYAPTQTGNNTPYAYTTGCAAPTAAPTPNMCAGNYTSVAGPNCDEGSYLVTTHTWSMDTSATPACTVDTQSVATMACGGKKANCLKGPIRDILSDAQIQAGARSLVYTASSGAVLTSTFTAPSDVLDLTNLRVANGTVNNKCLTTNADADTWTSTQAALLASDNPFAGGSNPYYVMNCLDAAKDIKARIRIVVRDWNKTFKLKDSIDFDLPAGGALMNDNTIVFGKSNNDFADWDDAYNGPAAAPGGAGTCAAPAFTSNYKFPRGGI